jgi:hypothetical protein
MLHTLYAFVGVSVYFQQTDIRVFFSIQSFFSILEIFKFVVGAPFHALFEIVLSKTENTINGVKI